MHYLVRVGITFHIAQAVRPRQFDYQHRISLTSLIEMHDGVYYTWDHFSRQSVPPMPMRMLRAAIGYS